MSNTIFSLIKKPFRYVYNAYRIRVIESMINKKKLYDQSLNGIDIFIFDLMIKLLGMY